MLKIEIIELVIILESVSGCSSLNAVIDCQISNENLSKLQKNGHEFIENKLQDPDCEVISENISYIKHYGCGIYGGPSIKKGCPKTLDGNYWIIFNPDTLIPKKLVLIGR